MIKRNVIVVVGPTGVGKTDLSIELAQRLNGEVISADSRQIYIGMDIGTAKPTSAQLEAVPHHLISIVQPDYVMSLVEFQHRCQAALNDVISRGRIPILVGGTGQYIRAIVDGWSIPRVAPNMSLREQLDRSASRFGKLALYSFMIDIDPQTASRLDYHNIRRVIRSIEIYWSTKNRQPGLGREASSDHRFILVGLTCSREILSKRNDERIDSMLSQGLVDEVAGLLSRGYEPDLPSMTGLGYREIGNYLTGRCTFDASISEFRRNTRDFVRRQYTWFKYSDPNINWFDVCIMNRTTIISSIMSMMD